MLKEILDSLELVSKSIKNIGEIHTAVKKGVGYFSIKHPAIKADVSAMCQELQKTCNAIAVASSVITNFKFNESPGAIDSEPTRFNNYFIQYKQQSTHAEGVIIALKGSCYKIKTHIEKYNKPGLGKSIFGFFGLHSEKKEHELMNMLQIIYDDEQDFHNVVFKMARSMNVAIEDITKALMTNNTLKSSNVPKAASLLEKYAAHFKELETLATTTKEGLDETIRLLDK